MISAGFGWGWGGSGQFMAERRCSGLLGGKIQLVDQIQRTFGSFADADSADIEEDMLLTPEQRIALVFDLQERLYPDAAQQGFARICRVTQLSRS